MSDFDAIYPGPRYILKTEYEELEGRFKELEEENKSNGELAQKWGSRVLLDSAEKHRLLAQIRELEVENEVLRNKGSVCYGLYSEDGFLLMDWDTEQLKIYETLSAAHRSAIPSSKIARLLVRRYEEDDGNSA